MSGPRDVPVMPVMLDTRLTGVSKFFFESRGILYVFR